MNDTELELNHYMFLWRDTINYSRGLTVELLYLWYICNGDIYGLVQEYGSSSANALELL